MSATLGYVLLMVLALILVAFIVFQLVRSTIETTKVLDKYINEMKKQKPITNELQLIKSFMATTEHKLQEIQEFIEEEDNGR